MIPNTLKAPETIKYIVMLAMTVIALLLFVYAKNTFFALGSVGIGIGIMWKAEFLPPKWRFVSALGFFALAYILYKGWIL